MFTPVTNVNPENLVVTVLKSISDVLKLDSEMMCPKPFYSVLCFKFACMPLIELMMLEWM